MMKEQFWKIINQVKSNSCDFEERPAKLKELLMQLTPEEVIAFESEYYQKMADAYRWDLWGAAYIINGGCSDDGFHYFCAFLISEGEEVFTKALSNPESLADADIEEDADLEEFNYVAREVYEEKTGKEMPDNDVNFPNEPVGTNWDEDDLDSMFPILTKKYS